jgi:hypothetical protein
MKALNRLELFTFLGIVIGIWGLTIVFNEEVQSIRKTSRNILVYELFLVMTWMFFMRIITLMIVACLLTCYCILFCCLICLGRR